MITIGDSLFTKVFLGRPKDERCFSERHSESEIYKRVEYNLSTEGLSKTLYLDIQKDFSS